MMIPRVGPVPPGIPTVRPPPGLGRPGPGGEPGRRGWRARFWLWPFHERCTPYTHILCSEGVEMSVARKNAVAAGEADSTPRDLMKAIVQDRFGPPDTLRMVDTEIPEIGSGDVLLKVHAAAVNPYDWHMLRGDPRVARLMGGVGLTKPKARIAGVDVAGRVHDVGADVHGLRPGDEVFGFARGAFAEFAAADAALVVPKPAALSFEQVAALPMAAVTALHAIRDRGHVQPGQRVLVNGAAGGVGTFAVSRSRPRSVPRSPACAAPGTPTWCGRSAPPTWSTTRRTTSPTAQFDST